MLRLIVLGLFGWFIYGLRRLRCLVFFHDWTSFPEHGILPTQEQTDGGKKGYLDYSKIMCRYCGVVHPESKKAIDEYAKLNKGE